MIHPRQVKLHLPLLLLVFLGLGTISEISWAVVEVPLATLPLEEFPQATFSPTTQLEPAKTEIITLPFVEQNAGDAFLTPVVESILLQETPVPGSQGPSPTPTSTPLPPQTGATNLPVVIGASVIYMIILLAWLLVGWRPRRSHDL